MFKILKIAGLILEQIGGLFSDVFFWIIVMIMIITYRKNADMEARMTGSSYNLFSKVLCSVLVGLAGGLAGSLLAILVGISIEDYTRAGGGSISEAIVYMWIIAMLLAVINPRYLCFSYAGGIIALMNLIFGFPPVNVPGLLALIGVLHLIESFLIWLDGYTYSVPLFLRRGDGKIVGGYYLNKIWPIPLVVFAVILGREGDGISLAGLIRMPDWWPLLKHSAAGGYQGLVYLPFMVPVVLGFGDMAVTKTPVKKCADTAKRLGVYSLVLLLLSLAAVKLKFFAYAAAVFAPLAHELLILYGLKEEEEGKSYFESSGTGVKILYVKRNSIAAGMNIEAGDTILTVNGKALYSWKQLAEFLQSYPPYIWMDVAKAENRIVTVEHSDYRNGIGSLGALAVPEDAEFCYELKRVNPLLKRFADMLRGKNGKNAGM